MPNPTAAVLIIGNEVLSGRTADANLNAIARRLADVGINLQESRTVRDDRTAIIDAVNALRRTYTYVFTTGGIGPTHDDITINTLAAAFGVAVERNLQVEERLKTNYAETYTSATLRMADYPAGARLIWHGEPYAPGFMMENVIVMAGQPRVMQVMLEAALPHLNQGTPLHTRQLDVWVNESAIAEKLEAIQSRFPEIDIGSYPYRIEGKPGTALVTRGENLQQVEKAYKAIHSLIEDQGLPLRTA